MAAPVLVQHGILASSSAAPATFVGTFGQASTAGTCLIVKYAAAMSAAGTISVPAGWTRDTTATISNASIFIGTSIYNNNPGGVTGTGTMTLTNVNGIVLAWYEWSGLNVPATSILARLDREVIGSSTAPSTGTGVTPTDANSVWVGAIAHLVGQTLTAANVPATGVGAWVVGDTASSTVGATNVTLHNYYATPGPQYPDGGLYQIAGTLTGATSWGAVLAAFPAVESGPLASMTAEGGLGMVVTGGAGYAIGG